MNKQIVKLSLLFAVIFCTATISLAEMGYINIYLSDKQDLTPDKAQIVITVETNDKSSKIATENNKKISSLVQTKIKTYIDTKNGDYVKTSNYSLTPRYKYKDGKSIFDKYVIQNSITVYTKNLDNISKIIDTAIENGATDISNLNYTLSNYDEACTAMISDLLKKSQANANKMLSPIKQQTAGIKSINTNCSTTSNNNRVYVAKALKTESTSADNYNSTTINHGKVTLNASVDVSYFVKTKN